MRLVLPILLLSSTALFSQPLQQISPYFVGHSLVNFNMPAMIKSLADDAGKTDLYACQIGNGGNLHYQWDTLLGIEQGLLWQDALPTGQYDAMVITEAVPLLGHLLWNHTYDFADSFLIAARLYRPAIRFFIYETWHCNTTGTPAGCPSDDDDDLLWRPRLASDFPLWTGIMDTLKNRHSGATVWMVPAGQAFGMLVDSIEAGTVPGITDFTTLFSDDIHLTDVGNYFVACVMYACLFRESPEGRTAQTYSQWGTPFTPPTPAQAQKMQQIAWKTVTSLAARTGVFASTSTNPPAGEATGLQVFPNPVATGETLSVFSEKNISGIEVFDARGKTIYRQSYSGVSACAVQLPRGGFNLLKIETTDGKVAWKKVMVY